MLYPAGYFADVHLRDPQTAEMPFGNSLEVGINRIRGYSDHWAYFDEM